MKIIVAGALVLIAIVVVSFQLMAQSPEVKAIQNYEYASVRFMNGNRTSFVWPDGRVEKLNTLTDLRRPDTADERMFHLTIAMNILAKRGYEPVAIPSMSQSPDDVVMRRPFVKQ